MANGTQFPEGGVDPMAAFALGLLSGQGLGMASQVPQQQSKSEPQKPKQIGLMGGDPMLALLFNSLADIVAPPLPGERGQVASQTISNLAQQRIFADLASRILGGSTQSSNTADLASLILGSGRQNPR